MILAVVVMFLRAWAIMIVAGIVNLDWIPQVPTLGFGTALAISIVITAVRLPAIIWLWCNGGDLR